MRFLATTHRRRAFGLISYITPIAVPVFIVLFYAPIIAVPLRVQGWSKAASLGVGLLLPLAWIAVITGTAAIVPVRFAKLKEALECIGYGLPLLGALVLLLWAVAATLWRLAN